MYICIYIMYMDIYTESLYLEYLIFIRKIYRDETRLFLRLNSQ